MRSTMDAICKLGFGVEVNSLSNIKSGPEASFANAFEIANIMLFGRHFDPAWKLKRYFNIGSEATIKKSIKIVDDFVYNVIQTRRHEISLQNNNVRQNPQLINCLICFFHISLSASAGTHVLLSLSKLFTGKTRSAVSLYGSN